MCDLFLVMLLVPCKSTKLQDSSDQFLHVSTYPAGWGSNLITDSTNRYDPPSNSLPNHICCSHQILTFHCCTHPRASSMRTIVPLHITIKQLNNVVLCSSIRTCSFDILWMDKILHQLVPTGPGSLPSTASIFQWRLAMAICKYNQLIYMHTQRGRQTHTYIYICMCAYMHAHIYICIYV